jgi:hypothetical protein
MIYRRRNTRTDLDLVNAGDFVKVGRRHFRHESGLEITYDCNRSHWLAAGNAWQSLEWAAYQVRKAAGAGAKVTE